MRIPLKRALRLRRLRCVRTQILWRLRSFCDKAGLIVKQVHWLSKMNATLTLTTGSSGTVSSKCCVTRVPKRRLDSSLSGTESWLTLHLAIARREQLFPDSDETVSGVVTTCPRVSGGNSERRVCAIPTIYWTKHPCEMVTSRHPSSGHWL